MEPHQTHEAAARTDEFRRDFANWDGLRCLSITFDVDWAPDYMLRHVLRILDAFDARVTFFATHDSSLLRQIAAEGRHEVGFHPNLGAGSSQGETTDAILDNLAGWYPQSVGCRFHVLGFSYRDLFRLARHGIRYDVSRLMFNTSHLLPARHRDLGLNLFPYMWEDGIAENARHAVAVESMDLATPGLKILNFHPMNVFINGPDNAPRLAFINAVGPLLECPEDVARRHRLEGATGAQRALEGLLDYAGRRNVAVRPLRDLHHAFDRVNGADRDG